MIRTALATIGALTILATAVVIAAMFATRRGKPVEMTDQWETQAEADIAQAIAIVLDEEPVVPKPRDPADVVAFHSTAKGRTAAQIAANAAERELDDVLRQILESER